MAVSSKHILEQGPVLRGLGEAALMLLRQRLEGRKGGEGGAVSSVEVPGPELERTVPPRSRGLVRDYVRNVGGDPSAYKSKVPPHLFPQWGFPFQGHCMKGLAYPLARAMNGGCRMEIRAPLPIDAPLSVRARLERIDDDGRRAIIEQRIVTGTPGEPEALTCYMQVFVPLKREAKGGPKKEKPRVPEDAREIAKIRVGREAGLDFAKLTGDFNPVHWIPAYAKAFGFRNTILHGFGTMARAIEAMNRNLFVGDVDALASLEVRFTRPVVLPAQIGVYVQEGELWVGDAPGGPAYLVGSYRTR